jgi:hypothetical protein
VAYHIAVFRLRTSDDRFEARSQGYVPTAPTNQAIKGLGITSLESGVVSTKHIVHNTEGKYWENGAEWAYNKPKKVLNVPTYMCETVLRLALLEAIGTQDKINWGHQLVHLKTRKAKV